MAAVVMPGDHASVGVSTPSGSSQLGEEVDSFSCGSKRRRCSTSCCDVGDMDNKSRKRSNLISKTVYTTHTYDGYQWRKYGHKEIKGSVPRSYFRCTYSGSPHNCKAIKQVQELSHDPPSFSVTYSHQHTCNNNHQEALQFTIIDSRPYISSLVQEQQQRLLVFGSSSSSSNITAAGEKQTKLARHEFEPDHSMELLSTDYYSGGVTVPSCSPPIPAAAHEPLHQTSLLKQEMPSPFMEPEANFNYGEDLRLSSCSSSSTLEESEVLDLLAEYLRPEFDIIS